MSQSVNEVYARIGTRAIPKILGLLNRNRLSPTYGCFDKAFWHYRTACFPSGMAQEFVLPLALVYRHAFAGGDAFYRQPALKEWVCAGIRYANTSAHRDGSCDDYFPYERALGAVAFSLYACTESALLQKVLIVGKKRAAVRFCRTVDFTPPITLTDELWDERPRRQGNHRVADLYAGTDHTSIYVAMSNAYDVTSLFPWSDYADCLDDFYDTGYLKTTRLLTKD